MSSGGKGVCVCVGVYLHIKHRHKVTQMFLLTFENRIILISRLLHTDSFYRTPLCAANTKRKRKREEENKNKEKERACKTW